MNRAANNVEPQAMDAAGRFASVYRLFPDAEAFLSELEKIRKADGKPAPEFHPGRGARRPRKERRIPA